jgi:septum formation protein
MHLILASQSPRRRELLTAAGISFTVRVSPIPEEPRAGESPRDYVTRLAAAKAAAVERAPGEIVLAADTTVVIGDRILEKPATPQESADMLRALAGQTHQVITGICLLGDKFRIVDAAITSVVFSPLSEADIAAYAATDEPYDKAGGYAIQGLASKFIERIDGDYSNVVGLPVSLVWRYLRSVCE